MPKCAVKGCEEEAHIYVVRLGGATLCDMHYSEYKFEGKDAEIEANLE